jgi:hypothetical protein
MKSSTQSFAEGDPKPRNCARSKTNNSFFINKTIPKFRTFLRGLG